jgi:hypothetical protein
MEEISKNDAPISKAAAAAAKVKKPRTEKQIEAFKRCAEKRKQKFLERKQTQTTAAKDQDQHQDQYQDQKPASSIKVEDAHQNDHYKNLAEQIELLKNQVSSMKQEKEKRQATFLPPIMEEAMEIDEPIPIPVPQHQYQHQHQQRTAAQRSSPVQIPQRKSVQFGQGMAYNVYDGSSNYERNRKRDVRGMDPYIDEKQGMMEKIYSRNVNQMKQQQMDALNANRMSDENSVQLLPSSVNVDRHAPVENMSNMIRSSSFTNSARKQNAIAFNGYRVATRFR